MQPGAVVASAVLSGIAASLALAELEEELLADEALLLLVLLLLLLSLLPLLELLLLLLLLVLLEEDEEVAPNWALVLKMPVVAAVTTLESRTCTCRRYQQ